MAVNYATLRCDAIEYAKGRNKLLEAATRAYLLCVVIILLTIAKHNIIRFPDY